MKKLALFFITVFIYGYVYGKESINSGWSSYFSSDSLPYTTMSLIEKLGKNIESIQPEVEEGNTAYLSSSSCLGYFGPVGPYGPLGLIGPIGDNTWNPETWLSTVLIAYNDWYDLDSNGPLSMLGPLGYKGPLSEDSYYYGSLFLENNFAIQLRALGLWTVLGPIGPFGALGALGPLGPLGSFAGQKDENGQYLDKSGNVIRTCTVQYDDNNKRIYELYENYNEEFASKINDNDTSFMVEGYLESGNNDSYNLTTSYDQFVTVLAVPLAQYENINLRVIVNTGTGAAFPIVSESGSFVNFIQLAVKAGTKLTVEVIPKDIVWNNSYRLFVTGGTQYLNKSNIMGKHIEFYQGK